MGAQAQQIVVRSETEAVQTATSAVGTVINSDTLTTTPLTTRNYTNLLGLSSGAQVGVYNAVNMGRGSQDIAVNGSARLRTITSRMGHPSLVFLRPQAQ